MSKRPQIITNCADRIEGRYDPENDVIVGAPRVTATDRDLLEMIRILVIEVERLQALVDVHLDTHR